MYHRVYGKVSLITVALAGLAASAEANTTRFFSATNCLGNLGGDENIVGRFKEGCFNYFQGPGSFNDATGLCGPDAIVSLPITGNNSDTVDFDGLSLNYVNGSFSEQFTCTAFVVNSAGTSFASSTQHSAVAPTSIDASGNLAWSSVTGTLSWTGATLPNAGAAIANVRTQSIFCVIPSIHPTAFEGSCFTSTVPSYIINYTANTVAP